MKLAIIPARGGSKRIPRKNIKAFCGQPMIAYSIKAAIESGCFDHVIVSTDDDEIASVARDCGAEVPFVRPAELSDDYCTSGAVIKHAILWAQRESLNPTHVCCIYATAPFVKAHYLKQGLEKLLKAQSSYVFSATSFPFPIQRAIKLDEQGQVSMFQPEHYLTRSQDLEESYHDAGQFYWGTTESFLNELPLFDKYSQLVLLPRSEVQDIDTPEDWEYAELLFKLKYAGSHE